MNVQAANSSIQSSEQYRIRAKQQEEQAQQLQAGQSQEKSVSVDEYDKANPVGEEVEGIYSVSHDDDGNLKVNYIQPSSKDESSAKTESVKSESGQSAEKSQGTAAAPSASSEDTSSDNEEKIKELEEQKNALQQKLNRENNEDVKAQIRTQILAVEAQIIQLKTAQI